jgi:hypothetical protein
MTRTRTAENRQWSQQKSALTRAINSKDPAKVIATTAKTVGEWEEQGSWPDAWSRWQRALDDAFDIVRDAYVTGESDVAPDGDDYDIDQIARRVRLGA